MDLIDRSKINFYHLTGPELKSAIEEAPSVPAVPLDKLCEWLAGYAEPAMEAETWKEVLNKWMEEQDAKEKT